MTPQQRAAIAQAEISLANLLTLQSSGISPNDGQWAQADRALKSLRAALEEPEPSVDYSSLAAVLRGGRQCDEDGTEIIMSRQACCEAADILEQSFQVPAQPSNEIMRQALLRIAVNTYGDTVPQVIAGEALHQTPEAPEVAGVEPLGAEFAKVLHENTWELYEGEAVEPAGVEPAPKPEDLAKWRLGWERYEKARKLNPHEWGYLHRRNLSGEHFDGMIDALPGRSYD